MQATEKLPVAWDSCRLERAQVLDATGGEGVQLGSRDGKGVRVGTQDIRAAWDPECHTGLISLPRPLCWGRKQFPCSLGEAG